MGPEDRPGITQSFRCAEDLVNYKHEIGKKIVDAEESKALNQIALDNTDCPGMERMQRHHEIAAAERDISLLLLEERWASDMLDVIKMFQ